MYWHIRRYGWQLRAQFNGIQILNVPDTYDMCVLAVAEILAGERERKISLRFQNITAHGICAVRCVFINFSGPVSFFFFSFVCVLESEAHSTPLIRLNLMSWACREMGPKHTNKRTWQTQTKAFECVARHQPANWTFNHYGLWLPFVASAGDRERKRQNMIMNR